MQEDVTERRRTERALVESERRYRALFEQSFQSIGILDPDGTVREANATWLALAGLAPVEALGLPVWETPWWRACGVSRARLSEAVASAAAGEIVQFRGRCAGRDGAVHEMETTLKPVRDCWGGVAMLVLEARDITQLVEQRRRLKREAARLANAQRIGRMGGWDFDLGRPWDRSARRNTGNTSATCWTAGVIFWS